MALRKTTVAELPSTAIRLTREEAIEYQYEAIRQWQPESEMWPLMYGSLAMGAVSSLSGAVINEYFRRTLFLPKSSLIVIGMPVIGVASLILTIAHHKLTSDLLLMNTPCMPCLQGKSALLVGFFGTIYPVIGSSVGNMMQAQRMGTTYIPSLTKERPKFFKFWQQLIQKKSSFFAKSLAVNIVLATVVTHYQQKAFFRLNQQDQ
ncbi:uncharacterized protein LOC124350015 [Daphnia pulicaria]|uniref:uncharacterized protein LOC124350015 n=1 Tax=Daphnia pulicaria TaxID=35523 RepID=UPI001EE9B137|nr:uncharacterized protein LOC124350015 [Daphnia pulicaria]